MILPATGGKLKNLGQGLFSFSFGEETYSDGFTKIVAVMLSLGISEAQVFNGWYSVVVDKAKSAHYGMEGTFMY